MYTHAPTYILIYKRTYICTGPPLLLLACMVLVGHHWVIIGSSLGYRQAIHRWAITGSSLGRCWVVIGMVYGPEAPPRLYGAPRVCGAIMGSSLGHRWVIVGSSLGHHFWVIVGSSLGHHFWVIVGPSLGHPWDGVWARDTPTAVWVRRPPHRVRATYDARPTESKRCPTPATRPHRATPISCIYYVAIFAQGLIRQTKFRAG